MDVDNNQHDGEESAGCIGKVLFADAVQKSNQKDEATEEHHQAGRTFLSIEESSISVLNDLKDYEQFFDLDIDRGWNAECSLMIRTRSRIDAAKAVLQECDEKIKIIKILRFSCDLHVLRRHSREREVLVIHDTEEELYY
jgi:hypothetical protein